MTYEDAMKALAYLREEIGVTGGEAYQDAVQEIADAVGDNNFIDTVGGYGLGDLERARNVDMMREQAAAKKKKVVVPVASAAPEVVKIVPSSNVNRMYGNAPLTEAEWNKIRSLYGSEQ